MENNKQYDFFLFGQRRASDFSEDLRRQAKEIGEVYGEQAKLEFESGVASIIPRYGKALNNFESDAEQIHGELNSDKELVVENVQTNYGVENTRNNSYFGTSGTGVQYSPDGKYNEPKKR